MNIPHADLLARIETGLGTLQDCMDNLDAQLSDLRAQGVFLDPDDQPVVPGWSERKEKNGRHVAWVLVWPTAYTKATGSKRRQYVGKADLEELRARTERTRKYDGLLDERRQLENNLRAVGNDLQNIVRWRRW
jgi:hypothetical protein